MQIVNPVLKRAYEAGWYHPCGDPDVLASDEYKQAEDEGWHEWIEHSLDIRAMREGYRYEQSLDIDGEPIYWLDGWWHNAGGEISDRNEREFISFLGKGDKMTRFCESFLRFSKEPLAGEPYRFIDWQRKTMLQSFGWCHNETRRRRFRRVVMQIAKKNGKALQDDTPVPTPGGWKKHGDLKVGDEIFDARGDVCHVVAVHPKTEIDKEVVFTNGEKVKCNGEHLWAVESRYKSSKHPDHRKQSNHYPLCAWSTADMQKRGLTTGKRGQLAFRLMECSGLAGSEESLPIDPYVLGAWLGDGRMREAKEKRCKNPGIYVQEINDIDPAQGNCITVSSGDGTYLCGRTMLPTHNSDLASAIGCFMVRQGGPKSYGFGCASDRQQARIIYDEAASYAKSTPAMTSDLECIDSRGRILHRESGSWYQVISSESRTSDGADLNFLLYDEIHRAPNRKLYDVLLKSGLARAEPLQTYCTTFGDGLQGVWGTEIYMPGKAFLEGRSDEWRTLYFTASAEPFKVRLTKPAKAGDTVLHVHRLEQPIDPDKDISFKIPGKDNEIVVKQSLEGGARRYQWHIDVEPVEEYIPELAEATVNESWTTDHAIIRANPSVGVVFPIENVREQIDNAIGHPHREALCKQLNLNIVANTAGTWLSGAAWSAASSNTFDPNELIGQRCVAGLDLSYSNDLTALCLAFPNWHASTKYTDVKAPEIKLLTFVWVPEEGIAEREEAEVPYRYWSERDYVRDISRVRISEGSVIDYEQVGSDIVKLSKLFKFGAVLYDPAYSAFVIEPFLENKGGITCFSVRQTMLNLAPYTKAFENAFYQKELWHGDHPVLNMAVGGAVAKMDDQMNVMVTKSKSTSRVDALVAAIMAVGGCVIPPVPYSGAWSSEGSGSW